MGWALHCCLQTGHFPFSLVTQVRHTMKCMQGTRMRSRFLSMHTTQVSCSVVGSTNAFSSSSSSFFSGHLFFVLSFLTLCRRACKAQA